MCVFFYSSFVCKSAYANVYFKTTIIKPNIKIILTAGVPSSQALPGFLITAPPSVCVPAVLGALAVWIQNQKKSFGSDPNVILTRQACGQRSGMAVESKCRGLAFYFSIPICYLFPLSKCRGE